MSNDDVRSSMDPAVASRIIAFIHQSTGRNTIVCDSDGTIVAARIQSRVGTVHPVARRMLREGLPHAKVTLAEEEASGGVVKAGFNRPIHYGGELIGSFGIAGDPELTEPIGAIAAGLIVKELQELEMSRKLLDHATRMDASITQIVDRVAQADAAQAKVTQLMDAIAGLIGNSMADIAQTHQVVEAIQSIAKKTQMLAINATIEAAHAQQFGRGFAVVAAEVSALSKESVQSTRTITQSQSHLQHSMTTVAAHAKILTQSTQLQAQVTGSIREMVAGLKVVSEGLIEMASSNGAPGH